MGGISLKVEPNFLYGNDFRILLDLGIRMIEDYEGFKRWEEINIWFYKGIIFTVNWWNDKNWEFSEVNSSVAGKLFGWFDVYGNKWLPGVEIERLCLADFVWVVKVN